jgi:hypothetical protein
MIIFSGSALVWAGFIKPNIGDYMGADVGQTMKLFTQPALHHDLGKK